MTRKSWAPWVTARPTRRDDAAEKAAVERVQRALTAALANERREAWWRLGRVHEWKGSGPIARVVPADELRRFRAFWNAMGAVPHVTEGAE